LSNSSSEWQTIETIENNGRRNNQRSTDLAQLEVSLDLIVLFNFLSFFLPRVDLALFESKRLNERPLTLTDHRDMSDIQMSLSVETEWWRSSNERRTVLVNRGIKRGEISSKLGGSKIGNQVCIE